MSRGTTTSGNTPLSPTMHAATMEKIHVWQLLVDVTSPSSGVAPKKRHTRMSGGVPSPDDMLTADSPRSHNTSDRLAAATASRRSWEHDGMVSR